MRRISGSSDASSNTSEAERALLFSDNDARAKMPRSAVPTIRAEMLTEPPTSQAPSPEVVREFRQASTIEPNISRVRCGKCSEPSSLIAGLANPMMAVNSVDSAFEIIPLAFAFSMNTAADSDERWSNNNAEISLMVTEGP